MGQTISAEWRGRLVRAKDRTRLLRRLEQVAAEVAPCLDASWSPVARVLEPPVRLHPREGSSWLFGPVGLQGGVLSLVDWNEVEHRFPFVFVAAHPPGAVSTLKWRLVTVFDLDASAPIVFHRQLAEGSWELGHVERTSGDDEEVRDRVRQLRRDGYTVVLPSSRAALSDRSSVDLRYDLNQEFDHLMAWVKTFFVPGLDYWRGRELSGLRRYRRRLRALEAGDDLEERATAELVRALRRAHGRR